jgi:hypothetical protein
MENWKWMLIGLILMGAGLWGLIAYLILTIFKINPREEEEDHDDIQVC